MALDIDERHLLRLGHGEEELQTEKDFSRLANTHVHVLYPMYLSSMIYPDLVVSTLF